CVSSWQYWNFHSLCSLDEAGQEWVTLSPLISCLAAGVAGLTPLPLSTLYVKAFKRVISPSLIGNPHTVARVHSIITVACVLCILAWDTWYCMALDTDSYSAYTLCYSEYMAHRSIVWHLYIEGVLGVVVSPGLILVLEWVTIAVSKSIRLSREGKGGGGVLSQERGGEEYLNRKRGSVGKALLLTVTVSIGLPLSMLYAPSIYTAETGIAIWTWIVSVTSILQGVALCILYLPPKRPAKPSVSDMVAALSAVVDTV
ncbi:hypothetical protein KIPB_005571, partial [Kipferlia bialata]